ncbi:LLM class flavin-dependent oxidoreductase [Micromonospora sp. PSH03]|uniref:MupA/Atu3671 family FMN-dependent luciferase-like monooxygenase n=1 Tax=Micromonospora salmantinae TaxID=2911211 RepID=UPI001EE7EE2A|nr:MupA/Atu3671 family FMN-dependent luciferase-like monooxygenase [Micromonospora salmantinae]MCG5454707.1 LLM class flavin-dependent oxidoreductase [Micromonospora salmantinae]
MNLSVLFFGADDASTDNGHREAYDRVLRVASAADADGYHAVWLPERHFQQIGQAFSSPAVLAAALAVTTRRIQLRAGSVVLPLHHPLRIVEDWAIVDNLSGGRAGISLATGWHSKDFVLAPDRYDDRRDRVAAAVPLLRGLWGGDTMTLPDGAGAKATVAPGPRPISSTLPLWLTTSGNPATWEQAGRLGVNVLAATMGQTRAELAGKIRRYRQAYRDTGTGPGTVTLMAHTYAGADDDTALRIAGPPLRRYLRSYLGQLATNGDPATPAVDSLPEAQLDRLVELALRRYVDWGSLIGSPETCARSLADLANIGCDEVACFVDFGIPIDEILAGLRRIAPATVEVDQT